MVYKWKTYQYKVSADVVGKHFEELEKVTGNITSEIVLDSARNEDSPIHSLFEWDDSIAAEQYRLKQATTLICNLAVEIETDKKPIECRAFMEVTDQKVGTFMNVQSAFENHDTRQIVLDRAKRELTMFKQKYKNLNELAKVFDAIDEFEKAM